MSVKFNLSAFVTTQKLDRLMANAPNIGLSVQPNIGIHTPAASGIPIILYINAQKRFSFMFLTVALLSLMAAGTSVSSLFMRTTSAASMAISVPAPMAIPIFALVSAGASFIPSPTMITCPFCMRSRTTLSLPSGRTPAITLSTPTCSPMALAVLSLSPVNITTESPID